MKVIVSTNNGTSEQYAYDVTHVLVFMRNALEETDPGRVMVMVCEEEA